MMLDDDDARSGMMLEVRQVVMTSVVKICLWLARVRIEKVDDGGDQNLTYVTITFANLTEVEFVEFFIMMLDDDRTGMVVVE